MATTLLAFASLLLFLSLLSSYYKRSMQKNYNLPPGPKKLPILGNLHQLTRLPHQPLWLLSKKHGPVMHLRLGSIPAVVVSSLDTAREVLKTNDLDFCSRPHSSASDAFSYHCADVTFSPYGELWRDMRKMSTLEIFSQKKVDSFRAAREEEIAEAMRMISSSAAVRMNVSRMVVNLTSRIVFRLAFGMSLFDEVEIEKSRIYGLVREMQELMGGSFVADLFPAFWWVDWVTGMTGKLERGRKRLDDFLEETIAERYGGGRKKEEEEEDILGVYLRIQKETGKLSKQNVKALITDFLAEGTETTTGTVVWAMTELVRHPMLMIKAQQEVRTVAGSRGKVQESDLPHLPYLKSVIKETLRLHSPVPLLLPRIAMRRSCIAGYDIPPGTTVFVNVWGISRDPEVWEEPEVFKPERFFESSIDYKGNSFELLPFGGGRRVCAGITLGVRKVEIILASLLYSFDWKLPGEMREEDVNMEEAPGLVIQKRVDLELMAVKHIVS